MNATSNQRKQLHISTNKIIALSLLALGIILLITSLLFVSQIESIIGLGLTFWGAILLYITPNKHVPLQLLNAVTASTFPNIEKALAESELTEKGIYLPPRNLDDYESSIVFVPARQNQNLPTTEQIIQTNLYLKNPYGALLSPPGLALSKLFEEEIGTSFTKTDLNKLEEKLPNLLVENLEIAERAEINSEGNIINVTIKNCILDQICEETQKLKRAHDSVGCILSSAIACALAKSTGRPIIIAKEETNEKTTTMEFNIVEG